MPLSKRQGDKNVSLGRFAFAAAMMSLTVAFAMPVQAQSQQQSKARAQAGAARATARPLKFEVVSIRPDKNGEDPRLCHQHIGAATPDGYRMTCLWMIFPILQAYPSPHGAATVDASQELLRGFPSWLGRDRYDIEARVSGEDLKDWQNPALQPAMMRAMLRSMLAERLKLAVHHGSEVHSVYLLEVAEGGAKFKPTVPGEEHAASPFHMTLPGGGEVVMVRQGGEIIHHEYGITMAQFARDFPNRDGRPVLDHTGLKGRYDITYEEPFNMSAGKGQPHSRPPESGRSASSIAGSLGLKLVPAKRPIATLVCDHIERPTPN